jgi:hypothetical protein
VIFTFFDLSSFYPSYVSVDSSSDITAYPTTARDYSCNVASTTTIYGLHYQITYDMANDITIFPSNSSPRIFY